MDYPYKLEDLSRLVKISNQTVYRIIKKNQDFFKDNSKKVKGKTKPITLYNQAVLDFLLAQYGEKRDNIITPEVAGGSFIDGERTDDIILNDAPGGTSTELPSEPQKHEETPPEAAEDKSTITALQTKIEALEAQIEALEAERRELVKQNGNILLLLSQEKAEKALLLPAPKKSFGERIKALFHKDGSTN